MPPDTARARWIDGHGPIAHRDETVARIDAMVARLASNGTDADTAWSLLAAADRITCVALSVVAPITYARRFYPDVRPLDPTDFQPVPVGHTGGALHTVPSISGF